MTTKLSEIKKQLPPTCQILAVSKLQSIEKIRELHQQGQTNFAENYAQEARDKQIQLQDLKLNWHFIGRLQKNKVKDVVGSFQLIHSVDSLELAQEINKRAANQNLKQAILIQLNVAQEDSKGGFSETGFEAALPDLLSLENIQIQGLMTMPPLEQNGEQVRPYFQKLREIRDRSQKLSPSIKELSMGTSGDFLTAAQEGATWVRIGTLLFGERPTR